MKRSEINKALRDMENLINEYKFSLPPFCHFTPEEWQSKSSEYDEVRDNMLGWDITDYGLGDFQRLKKMSHHIDYYVQNILRM